MQTYTCEMGARMAVLHVVTGVSTFREGDCVSAESLCARPCNKSVELELSSNNTVSLKMVPRRKKIQLLGQDLLHIVSETWASSVMQGRSKQDLPCNSHRSDRCASDAHYIALRQQDTQSQRCRGSVAVCPPMWSSVAIG